MFGGFLSPANPRPGGHVLGCFVLFLVMDEYQSLALQRKEKQLLLGNRGPVQRCWDFWGRPGLGAEGYDSDSATTGIQYVPIRLLSQCCFGHFQDPWVKC